MSIKYNEDLLNRINDRIDKDNCWVWTGSYSVKNIPVLKFKQKTVYPRRVLYELEYNITLNEHLKSICKNKTCVNPEHQKLKSTKYTEISDFDALRFRKKITHSEKTSCQIWNGFRNPVGYGYFKFNSRVVLSHRFSYCIENSLSLDEITNKVILHSCDNPSCVNPDHLFLGTQNDNIRDCVSKNRNKPPSIYKTLDQDLIENIKDLRQNKISLKNIAKQLNIKYSTVVYVVYNKQD